ncbi:DUF4302 domain-containing protein [Ancylomarina euxinus]|uniref:DUF4302 domain-containing protein n=1 Tax=Ancylomarina euxinus TaxID=2283627 RepID=A0A425XZM9_9BACT|nr:DUF4302 domain-containing protein [Ancylomarina euxinus]MCZ4695464.1 DUF4302 domain-containing protein [Ancylomarina euxinus]MUP15718.1 DUF4302 domain-containing protein [Ancylomarina euxinus]RRG20709.1 DUF4302 domain-containing protein [Ancylomarina euxinus]
MRKILFLLIAVISFISCNDDDFESVFEKSPEERIAEANKKYKDLLTSSEFGWETNYFAVSESSMQGSTMIMKFNADGQVSILGDHTKIRETSEYIIHQEASTQIKFSTYNKNLTWLATPDRYNPEGMGGEIEFVFISSTEDEIIMEGKVNKGKLIFKKTNRTELPFWNFQAIKDQLLALKSNGFMAFQIEGDSKNKYGFEFDASNNNASISYNADEQLFKEERAVIFTTEGLIFNEPLILNGKEVSSLSYTGEIEKVEVAPNSGDKEYNIKTAGDFIYKDSNIELKIVNVPVPVFYTPGIIEKFEKNEYARIYFSREAFSGYMTAIKSEVTSFNRMFLLNNYDDGTIVGPGLNITFKNGNQAVINYEMIKKGSGVVQFIFGETQIVVNSDLVDNPDTEINEIEVEREAVLSNLQNSPGLQNYIAEMSKESGYLVYQKPFMFGASIFDFVSVDNPLNSFGALGY